MNGLTTKKTMAIAVVLWLIYVAGTVLSINATRARAIEAQRAIDWNTARIDDLVRRIEKLE